MLHGLRPTFTQTREAAGVPESTFKLLVGHAQSLTFGLYSKGPGLEQLIAAVDCIEFPQYT